MKFITAILGITLLSLATAILPEKCSAGHCGTNGASARCTQSHPFKVTTCGKWSTTTEARLQCRKLDCKYMSCYFIPVLASDGNRYCTPCHIHQVGCKTGFKVYGPVDAAVARQVTDDVETVSEDVEERSGVEEDSVERSTILFPICSMPFCTKNGALARCRVILPGTSVIANCFKFSFLPQSKEQCRFFCPLFCLPQDQQPVANTGQRFCNECLLRQRSCSTNYKLFGPVHKPTPSTTM